MMHSHDLFIKALERDGYKCVVTGKYETRAKYLANITIDKQEMINVGAVALYLNPFM